MMGSYNLTHVILPMLLVGDNEKGKIGYCRKFNI